MITLYTFGPSFGLPDGSPFVVKAMLLLKFAGLEYRGKPGLPPKAPKGKLPYIDDDGVTVADSTFIRFHIEKKYGFDFDAGLDGGQKAAAWEIEKMCEEHLYLSLLAARWLDDANFARGPSQFFKNLPLPLQLIVPGLVRRKIDKTLKLQGFGRHTRAEQDELAIADINALASLLGDKPYLMGDKPCGADAAVSASSRNFWPRRSRRQPGQPWKSTKILYATATAFRGNISKTSKMRRLPFFHAKIAFGPLTEGLFRVFPQARESKFHILLKAGVFTIGRVKNQILPIYCSEQTKIAVLSLIRA